jgi:nitroreductase
MRMEAMLELLEQRRSVVAREMVGPGPDDAELARLLRIAARVPDHGKLAPWRFIVFKGEARSRFGAVLARRFRDLNPDADAAAVALEAGRFERAPVVVAVISRAAPHPKIPEWEQQLSAGAVCQTLLVAASAMGFASQWITEWYGYDDHVAAALGLGAHERVAGFVYLASAKVAPGERARPAMEEIVSHWTGREQARS